MSDDLKIGFTTGSCAAAASKAAAYLLLLGIKKKDIILETPKGILYHAEILDLKGSGCEASCAVKKDGGDDPDVTTGCHIYAKVSTDQIPVELDDGPVIEIDGGEGVGRVTKPGLDMPVGEAAINSVPRAMIKKALSEVCVLADFKGKVRVVIYVPQGREIAEKTFNPRLGIEGGISILGTTGVVEPMSEKALIETIRTEINQRRAMGERSIIISPGNYGMEYMRKTYGYNLDNAVKCSNFIGDTVERAASVGFERLLLVGHIGKLVKLSGGIRNTHSKNADCRMELLAAAAISVGTDLKVVRKILSCTNTEAAIEVLDETDGLAPVMDELMKKVLFYLDGFAQGKMKIECIVFSHKFGALVESEGASKWFIS